MFVQDSTGLTEDSNNISSTVRCRERERFTTVTIFRTFHLLISVFLQWHKILNDNYRQTRLRSKYIRDLVKRNKTTLTWGIWDYRNPRFTGIYRNPILITAIQLYYQVYHDLCKFRHIHC